MNANINCHFSQKGLGENFYFLGFLLTHIGYWAGVIVIPHVHLKSIQPHFRLTVTDQRHLKLHISALHLKNKKIDCEVCNKTFYSKMS